MHTQYIRVLVHSVLMLCLWYSMCTVYHMMCSSPVSCADLTKHLVSDYTAISELMDLGNTHRYVHAPHVAQWRGDT